MSIIQPRFLNSAAAGGLALVAAAALALITANSPLAGGYFRLLHASLGGLDLLHWINDGLMALFFLQVGLEIKRELIEGQLASWSHRALPAIAAAGGVIAPALIYAVVNAGSDGRPKGWAIPTATDIAFVLGVMSLLGARIPLSLKLLVTALAILDDLVAIVIIGAFYAKSVSIVAMSLAGLTFLALLALNRWKVRRLAPYLLLGALLWICVFKSGLHPTLAGVALAFAIPLRPGATMRGSPLRRLEQTLHPWVTLLITPLFGFANAGISFEGITTAMLLRSAPIGIAAGLFLGKPAGILGCSWAAVRLGVAQFPAGATWGGFCGVALLCGIGFTMSLFIGLLAFPSGVLQDEIKIAVIAGSLASAAAGWLVLRVVAPRRA